MTGPKSKEVEVLGAERRRRWSAAEKVGMVRETYEPGMTVSLVARRHGINPNQLKTCFRRTSRFTVDCSRSRPLISQSMREQNGGDSRWSERVQRRADNRDGPTCQSAGSLGSFRSAL